VSVGPILLEQRVKPRLPEFHERCRNIVLEFVPFNPCSDGERAIRSGAVDVLMYTGGPPENLSQRTEIISSVSCSIYGAPELVARLRAQRADLSAAPFVVLPKDYRISQWFEAQLALAGIRPRNVVARPPYMDVALRMAVAGKGLAVLFDEHAAEFEKRGQLVPLGPIGPGALSAFRVMMLGRRALRAQMAPALQFLRGV
jgi:DNA-binding transcriptional LysR family regulator